MLESHKPSPLLVINKKQPLISVPSSTAEEYHVGSPAAVPFTWESRPGTPKVKFGRRDDSLPPPPLTPPPSYFYSPSPSPSHYSIATATNNKKKHLLDTLFFFFFSRRSNNDKSSSSPEYSSSSSYSSTSSTTSRSSQYGARKSVADMLATGNTRHRKEDECDSPVSVLCFGAVRGPSPGNPRARAGCYGSFIKVLY